MAEATQTDKTTSATSPRELEYEFNVNNIRKFLRSTKVPTSQILEALRLEFEENVFNDVDMCDDPDVEKIAYHLGELINVLTKVND